MNNKPWNSIWQNKEKNVFTLYKTNNQPIILQKGSWIKILDIGNESSNKCIIDYVFHSKKNDKNKIEWCEKNNIYLIELPFNESEQQWRKRIED